MYWTVFENKKIKIKRWLYKAIFISCNERGKQSKKQGWCLHALAKQTYLAAEQYSVDPYSDSPHICLNNYWGPMRQGLLTFCWSKLEKRFSG